MEHPTPPETEDLTAAANHQQVMNVGAPTQMMVQSTAAKETLPTAGTLCADERVVVHTQFMTQTPLSPISRFIKMLCWDIPPLRW